MTQSLRTRPSLKTSEPLGFKSCPPQSSQFLILFRAASKYNFVVRYILLVFVGDILEKKRIIYIDVIRVLAMFMVVLAHACANRLSVRDGSLSWSVSNALVVITLIAVPLFFMISGATILNSRRTKDIPYLFKHRLVRVLVPFILWSIISAYSLRKIDHIFSYQDFFHSVLMMYHQPVLIAYWFIYPLVSLYLLSPLLKAMVENMDDTLLNYLLALWLVISMLLPALVSALPKNIGVYFDGYTVGKVVFSSSLGYFILGHKLTQTKHQRISSLWTAVLIFILVEVNVLIGFFGLKDSLKWLNIIQTINVPIIAALVFLLLKSFEGHYHNWFIKTIEVLAPLTYGVYLVHGLSIEIVSRMVGNNKFFIIFVLATIASLIVIFILSKIPFIKKIFL